MTEALQSPEPRLYTAGFTRQLEFWRTPDGRRVLNLHDAVAALDAGEVKPGGARAAGASRPAQFSDLTPERIKELADWHFGRPAAGLDACLDRAGALTEGNRGWVSRPIDQARNQMLALLTPGDEQAGANQRDGEGPGRDPACPRPSGGSAQEELKWWFVARTAARVQRCRVTGGAT